MTATPTPGQVDWRALAQTLFPQGHQITESEHFLSGTAQVDGHTVTVVGTTGHTPIGIEIALAQATAILDTVRNHPGRAIVILVDTQGQRLRHRDEMLGINSYMAHLGKCVELARRQGHRVIGLVYDQALSGGFITSGLIADACYALPEAEIRVMGIPAMARVTKLSEERLAALSRSSPVFAPGVDNYVVMGGIRALWTGDLAQALGDALVTAPTIDERAADGAVRGGRRCAAPIIERVLDAA